MKKFSNVTGEKIGDKPVLDIKIDERGLFKMKVLSMMENLLSIRTYGPIDRYYRAGSIEISGKELLAEAITSLLNDDTIKEQIKVLESLKSDIGDWEAIDKKIDQLNEKVNVDYRRKFKISNSISKYEGDALIGFLENKFSRINDINLMEGYVEALVEKGTNSEIVNKVNNILRLRVNEIRNK